MNLAVLLVEDNPNDARLLRRALERAAIQGLSLVHVRRLDEATARLAAGGINAILLDLTLPDSSGLRTVQRVHAAVPDVPIVVLTGASEADLGLRALQEGAQDYLVKRNLDGQLLDRALRYAIERHRHEERGRQLVQEQAARAAAEAALRARDEFLSVAAHELYTPITALQLSVDNASQSLLGSTSAAPTPPATEVLARRLEVIGRQTRRLGRLAGLLLEGSRLHVGRLDLQLEYTDLAAVVSEVAAGAEAELARSGTSLRLHGEHSLPGRWDRSRLEQVVTNLLSNAMKYGSSRPIDVTVSGDGDSVTLAVTDHGIGIAPETQERIFDRFQRGVSSHEYGGLGLGLYVVQGIVRAHGGTVRVESEPGRGSSFIVVLPRWTAGPARTSTSLPSAPSHDA